MIGGRASNFCVVVSDLKEEPDGALVLEVVEVVTAFAVAVVAGVAVVVAGVVVVVLDLAVVVSTVVVCWVVSGIVAFFCTT